MCLICIDLARSAMRPAEARRALGEMRTKLDAKHIAEVEAKVADAEQAQAEEAAAASPLVPSP